MFKRSLLVFLCVLPAVAYAQPTIQYKSRELQEGRNFVPQLTGTISVGESSGMTSYTYPIDVPKAHGVTPEVALEYSSHAGYSEIGWGWQLTLPMIERSDENGTVASKTFGSAFRFRNGQHTTELVYTGTYGGWSEYHERTETTFSRYLQSGNVWQILRPDGTIIDLGTAAPPGYNAVQGTYPSTFAGTSQWLVTRVTDSNGNYASYTYNVPGQISSISYGGNATTGLAPAFRVDFTYAGPIDARGQAFGYRSGFRRQFGVYRLTSIVVTAPPHATGSSPAVVPTGSPTQRTYVFEHASPGGFGNIYQLSSARIANEPYVYFTYQAPWSATTIDNTYTYTYTGGADFAFTGDLGFTDSVPVHGSIFHGGLDHQTSVTSRIIADVNSDGRPDVVESLTTGSYLVWKNTGGAFGAHEVWPAPSVSTGVTPPQAGSLRTVDTYSGVEADTVQDFFDLNGDGYPDLVYVVAGAPIRMAFCPGTGSGFGTCVNYNTGTGMIPTGGPYLRRDEIPASNVSSTDIDFIDMNADGRPDEVEAQPGTYPLANIIIRFNTGSSFESSTTMVTRPQCSFPGFPGCLRLAQSDSVTSGTRLLFSETRDINGDGLPDFLTVDTTTGLVWGAYNNGAYGAPGTNGAGWGPLVQLTNTSTSSWVNGPASIGAGYLNAQGISVPAEYTAISDLIDMDGDGLVDIVNYDCKQSPSQVTVRFNNGGVWDLTPKTYTLSTAPGTNWASPCLSTIRSTDYQSPPGSTNWVETRSYVNATVMDMNGDGVPDFVTAYTGPATTYPSFLVWQLKYQPPRKLVKVSALGGNQVMSIAYGALNTAAPYPIHVPTTVTKTRTALYATEPIQYRRAITKYSYVNGAFDRAHRQFTGFGTVVATGDSFAKTTTTNYGNDFQTSGLTLSQTSANNAASGAAMMTKNTFTIVSRPGGWWPRLDRSEVLPGLTRDLVTDYVGYDSYGQPTNWVVRGAVGTTDDVTHTRSYVTRETGMVSTSILHLVSVEGGSSAANGPLSTTRHYYDGLPLGSAPTRGNETALEREKTAGVYVATTSGFDSYGNITSASDEVGTTATFTYDSTYQMYRISATTPVGTTYTSFNALTAHIADICGPQYSGSSWNCKRAEVDALGRVTNVYVPVLANGTYSKALLSTYTYNDNTYPLISVEIDRGTHRTFQYRDGFGNATQVRSEETANTFRVWETAFDAYHNPARVELARREAGTAYTHAPISTEAWTYATDFVNSSIERITHPRDPGDTSAPATATHIAYSDHVTMTDEDGRQTDYYFDGFQRVAYSLQRGGSLGDARTTFTYNDRGDVLNVVDPNGLQTTYGRNLLGWIDKISTPNGTTSYVYNPRHQVVHATTPLGVSIDTTYDAAARVRTVVSSGEPAGVRHVDAYYQYYSNATPTQLGMLQVEYNGSRQANDNVEFDYTYTPEGMLETKTVDTQDMTGILKFTYAIGGRIDAVQYPDGTDALYSHNLDDSVSAVSISGQNVATFLYEDDGQPSSRTNDLGFDETYTYDARGRLRAIASTNTLGSLPGDLVDDRVTLSKASYVTELRRSGLAPGRAVRTPDTYSIHNDQLGRVDSVLLNGAPSAQYSYDLGSRITSFSEQGSAPATSTFVGDELTKRTTTTTTQSWTFDAGGSVTHDTLFVNGFSTRARDYQYDALGRLAKTTTNGASTEYFYTAGGEIAHVIGAGEGASTQDLLHLGEWARCDRATQTCTDRVIVNGEVVAEFQDGLFEMPHRSISGTVAAVTDDIGQVIRQEEFRPYGARSLGSGGGWFEDHFQGLRTDKVIMAGGRGYDAEAGTWLSRDPYVLANPDLIVATPKLGSMYAFEFGNPYRWRDASGYDPGDVPPTGFWDVLGAGIRIDWKTGTATAYKSVWGTRIVKGEAIALGGLGAWAMRSAIIDFAVGAGLFEGLKLKLCAGPAPASGPQGPVVDLFGGTQSQIPGAINVDLVAQEGIRADVARLPFADASVGEVVASGPRAEFLPEASRVLEPGGKLYINATKGNGFAKLPGASVLESLKLRVVEDSGPLADQFKNLVFRRTDGSIIPTDSVRTTILEKLP